MSEIIQNADSVEAKDDNDNSVKFRRDATKGMYLHTFRKPYIYEGTRYETLEFNFGKLTGRDLINIETEMQEKGEYAISPEYSRIFQCLIACKKPMSMVKTAKL